MAVYTKVTDQELSQFLKRYDVGAAISFKGIAEGVENSNFFVETPQARYILTLYEKRVNADDLPFFLDLMAFLVKAGLPSAAPIKDKGGQFLGLLNGRPAALIEFLIGTSTDTPSPAQCAALGDMLARLHLVTQSFPRARANTMGIAEWHHIFDHCQGEMNRFAPDLDKHIGTELSVLADNWPAGETLPKGIIHADLFPDNILFSDNKISGIIDFYFSCTDFYIYDLAICLNAWCFDAAGEIDPTCASALITAYQAQRCLQDKEKVALRICCRGAAVRFFLTRLHDWLHQEPGALVTVKDPGEYLRKLHFHQESDIEDFL